MFRAVFMLASLLSTTAPCAPQEQVRLVRTQDLSGDGLADRVRLLQTGDEITLDVKLSYQATPRTLQRVASGQGRAVGLVLQDIDHDGDLDLVLSLERAIPPKDGPQHTVIRTPLYRIWENAYGNFLPSDRYYPSEFSASMFRNYPINDNV